MSDAGNSNRITREYLDSLLIETRYMNAVSPSTSYELYGKTFASPLMTAYKNDPEKGIADYLKKAKDELAKAMAFTGVRDLSQMDPSIIHM